MSYARLVLDGDDAEATGEELLDEVVLLVVDRRPAKGADGADRVEQVAAVVSSGKVRVAHFLHPLGDAVERPVERAGLPVIGMRCPVEDLGYPVRVHGELVGIGPLGAEGALVDGALGVALDVDQLAALGVDELRAPHGAVGAEAFGDGGAAEAGGLVEPLPAVGLVGGGGAGPAGEIGHGGASVPEVLKAG